MSLAAGQYTRATDGTHIETDGIKRYVALLSQSGTDAPVATVLENTLGGAVVWIRDFAGTYIGTLAGAFTANKTFISIGAGAYPNQDDQINVYARRGSADTVTVLSGTGGSGTDDLLNLSPIEIRVYPA